MESEKEKGNKTEQWGEVNMTKVHYMHVCKCHNETSYLLLGKCHSQRKLTRKVPHQSARFNGRLKLPGWLGKNGTALTLG
jgi:hypothetical protein